MLSFPPPQEGNAALEGCPVVFVFDAPDHLAHLLRAIFDSSFFEPPPSQTELSIVESILRLSLKYDVQYLKRRALSHLNSTFPTTLSGWKCRDQTRTIPPIDNTPFASFRIARNLELDWLLPSILYCISSHPIEKILDHAVFADEEISFKWLDKRMCIMGRQKLLMTQAQNAVQMTRTANNHVEGCTGSTCSTTRSRCAETLCSWDMAGFLDYLEDNVNFYSQDFCPACQAAFKDSYTLATQQMWDDLPSMFSLPSWRDLEKIRVAASD